MPFTSASASRIGNNQIQVDWVYPGGDPTIDKIIVQFNYGANEENLSTGTTLLQANDWFDDLVVLVVFRSLGYPDQGSWEMVEYLEIPVFKALPPLTAPTEIVTGQSNGQLSLYFAYPIWMLDVPEMLWGQGQSSGGGES